MVCVKGNIMCSKRPYISMYVYVLRATLSMYVLRATLCVQRDLIYQYERDQWWRSHGVCVKGNCVKDCWGEWHYAFKETLYINTKETNDEGVMGSVLRATVSKTVWGEWHYAFKETLYINTKETNEYTKEICKYASALRFPQRKDLCGIPQRKDLCGIP